MSQAANPHIPSVEIRGLTRVFDDVVAVDTIDLTVERGEFLSLLGPSGCGKTTTLRMIGGLEQPTSGTILIGGADMTSVPPNRRPTSIVFQDYALFPHMSVVDNVAFGLKMRGVGRSERRERARSMLSLVNLEGMGDRKPYQLSGGQRQRVALARSLVIEPDVLLLDEPLGALDALIRRQMQSELLNLQRRVGLTFIYVTHDQEEAMAMSDRVAVMASGRIAQIGPPDEVYRRPRTEFVARFLGECNLLASTVIEASQQRTTAEADLLGAVSVDADRVSPILRSGDRGLAALRPEDTVLTPVDAGRIRGRIVERSYLGSRTRYVLDVHDHQFVVLDAGRSAYQVGDEAGIAWDDDDVCLVEPGAGSGAPATAGTRA
jgi:spermidine/putrescine ABC transporter ATP-binding subunit